MKSCENIKRVLISNLRKISCIVIIIGFLGIIFPAITFSDTKFSVKTELKGISNYNLREKYKGPFRHPFKLKPEAMQTFLESIQYSKNFIKWSKPLPLIPSAVTEKAAISLSQTFAKANRNQTVKFKINFQSLKIEGESFLNKYGLNWKIESVYNFSRGFKESKIWDNSWKLVPYKDQYNWQSKDLFGNKVKDMKWILIPTKTLKTVFSVVRKTEKPPFGSIGNQGFDERKFLGDLRDLKFLYKSGALDRQEYYENLDMVIKSSGWVELPFQEQDETFFIINKENLFPEGKQN